jgi:hypothetical protein
MPAAHHPPAPGSITSSCSGDGDSASKPGSAGAVQPSAAPSAAPSERLLALLQQHCLADSDLVPAALQLHHFCTIKQLCRQFHACTALPLAELTAAALAGAYAASAWLPSSQGLPLGRFMCAACRRFIVTGSVHMHMALDTHWAAVRTTLAGVGVQEEQGEEQGGSCVLAELARELSECLAEVYKCVAALASQAQRVAARCAPGSTLELGPLMCEALEEQSGEAQALLARCRALQGALEQQLLQPAVACYEQGGLVAGEEQAGGSGV